MAWHRVDAIRTVLAAAARTASTDLVVGQTVFGSIRGIMTAGTALTVPFVVTVLVLGWVVDFIGGVLAPFARLLTMLGLTGGQGGIVAQAMVLGIILAIVFLAGLIAEAGAQTGLRRGLGAVMTHLPGVGPVYSSFDRMSQVMLDGDATSFREVKLVEFPHADVYSLAFKTGEIGGGAAGGAADEPLTVLFVPLAPNPVMGGFMACVPESRIRDIDMTVQEAFQAIVTSGVAMAGSASSDALGSSA